MSQHRNRARARVGLLAAAAVLAGSSTTSCSTASMDVPPPTIQPATPASSPPTTVVPAGQVLVASGRPRAAVFDRATKSLAVLTPGADPQKPASLTVLGPAGDPRVVLLPAAATALACDGAGNAYLSTRGGVITVDLAAGTATRRPVGGQPDTDFTAIGRRADGRLVLGTAGGDAVTLNSDPTGNFDLTVAHTATIFARVDAVVTEGDVAVVLDRAQTSVTALNSEGAPQQALRAGLGATGIAADAAGRVLVTDTRGGQLLVFSVDPLIERQAYPVAGSPAGVAGSSRLVWVSQTATNTVVGYDLATGIPEEKVRYPTVQQPDILAFDDDAGTLYVVSGSGAGVQVIRNAAGGR